MSDHKPNQGVCIEQCAAAAFETYRAYCIAAHGESRPHWDDATEKERDATLEFVHRVIDGKRGGEYPGIGGMYLFDSDERDVASFLADVVDGMAVALGIREMRKPAWDGIEETDTRRVAQSCEMRKPAPEAETPEGAQS